MLHILTFLLAFGSLGSWLILPDGSRWGRPLGQAAMLGLLIYAGYFLLEPFGLVRLLLDLLIYIFGSLFVNTFSRSQLSATVVLLGLGAGYYFGFQPKQPHSAAVSGQQPDNSALVDLAEEGEFLLRVKNGYKIEDLAAIFNQFGLSAQPAFAVADGRSTDLDDFYLVDLPAGKSRAAAEVMKLLKQHIATAEVEYNESVLLSPMQPVAASASSQPIAQLNDPEIAKIWAFDKMKMAEFYQKLSKRRPAKKSRIAIIDSGIDAMHEDLMANLVRTGDDNDSDQNGHGSHCAGIAAAVSNNGKGIASFGLDNRWIELISVKVCDARGRCSQQKIINGMIAAADKGADVLSMSLGGPSSDETQSVYKKAVAYANKKGAVVVVAAGNENIEAKHRVPAGVEGVIVVTALNPQLQKASFSNTIQGLAMPIAAAGEQVYSTLPNNQYGYLSGTSMATPYVAGLVGIAKALRPELNSQQIHQLLQQSGQAIPDEQQTGRFIQPAALLDKL